MASAARGRSYALRPRSHAGERSTMNPSRRRWAAALTLAVVIGGITLTSCASPGVRVGDTAPDFTLLDDSGQPVRLYDVLAAKNVVLFFYPADMTPG